MNSPLTLKNINKLAPHDRFYNLPVPIIGLTGGIATGKTTVSKYLKEKRIPIIDADVLVKEIYKHPTTFKFIAKISPNSIQEEVIDFKNLREEFFKNEDLKTLIEEFIYNKLPEQFQKSFNKLDEAQFIVYDVPLLFEKRIDLYTDIKILVYCPQEIQIQRLIKRDQISQELAKSIIHSQMSIEEKKSRADIIIDNSQNLPDLYSQVDTLFQHLAGLKK